MADLDVLHYKYMTATAQKFRYPQFRLQAAIPTEDIEGVVAEWDIYEPSIAIDKQIVREDGHSVAVELEQVGHQVAKMLTTFHSKQMAASLLAQLRAMGSKERNARDTLVRETGAIQQRYGALFDEWMIAQCLAGSLAYTVGEEKVPQTITYAVQTATAGTTWATATTDILTDIRTQKKAIRDQTGMEPTDAWCNGTVINQILKNTTYQNWAGHTVEGARQVETGTVARFAGLDWHEYDTTYKLSATVTQFIADNKIIFTPKFDASWIAMQRGSVQVPNDNNTDFEEVIGPAVWSRVSNDPVAVTLWHKYSRLCVIKVPKAVMYFQTVP